VRLVEGHVVIVATELVRERCDIERDHITEP
jgi:hypothetical protein